MVDFTDQIMAFTVHTSCPVEGEYEPYHHLEQAVLGGENKAVFEVRGWCMQCALHEHRFIVFVDTYWLEARSESHLWEGEGTCFVEHSDAEEQLSTLGEVEFEFITDGAIIID